MTAAPRVSENLNRALHTLFDREERLYLLGEDVHDPYGGAFKISKGLTTKFGDRVLTTPLSEGGILGVGGGLALCGNKVIVEMMFGDFLALGFDQVLNFASKSVSMYGRPVPLSLVVRTPVGGNRGYGPTHSQSPQKHFVGIPNLALFELSPFHDAESVLEAALNRGTPSVLFEDKVLYTQRMYRANRVDDVFAYRHVGPEPGWAHAYPDGDPDDADFVVVAPGGVVHRALAAALALHEEQGRRVHVVTPAQLYPLDLEPVLPLLAATGRVAVVEEGTAGGTWGGEVARLLYERLWPALRGPVLTLSSADSIIPTAGHLERAVLLGAEDIRAGVQESAGWSAEQAATGGAAVHETRPGVPVTVPKLNNNDTTYLVVEWLVDDGAWVEPDAGIVSLETSKALEDVPATGSGYLRRVVPAGEERGVGEVLGYLLPDPPTSREPAAVHPAGEDGVTEDDAAPKVPAADAHRLDRAQQGIAAVVARSHREVPAGFTVVRVEADEVLDTLACLGDETGAALGLAEVVVKAVAAAHQDFPLFFGSLADDVVVLADAPHVGVTVDAAGSLYVPVVEHAHKQSVADLADALMDFRMKALSRSFSASDLDGGNITVSLNPDPGVVLVHPIVLWPQLCMVSVGAVGEEWRLDADGVPRAHRVVHIGLAYDHRVLNGRDAVLFLTRIRAALEEPAWLRGEVT